MVVIGTGSGSIKSIIPVPRSERSKVSTRANFFFFGPTFDLEFSQTIVSKVKFDVFNLCVNFDLNPITYEETEY